MRTVYRYRVENAGYLCGAVAAGAGIGWALGESDGSQGPPLGWWGGAALLAVGALVVVRILRRGTTIDDDGITKREVLVTSFVPWSDLVGISFSGEDRCVVQRRAPAGALTISGHPRDGEPSLAEAYRRVREDWTGAGVGARPYARPNRRWVTCAFVGSAAALIAGGLVWDEARHDASVYASRDRRERRGVAVVADVRVEGHDNGEDETTYTTFVDARLHLDDGRLVDIEVHRPGDLAFEYHDEDALPVVYDSAHPRDADFADRLTRKAQENSAAERELTGPLLYVGGLAGLGVFGAMMWIDWSRRLPATRRSGPTARSAPAR